MLKLANHLGSSIKSPISTAGIFFIIRKYSIDKRSIQPIKNKGEMFHWKGKRGMGGIMALGPLETPA